MGANPHRGEVEAPLKGGAVTLRPTWEALAAIEQATGLDMSVLTGKLVSGRISARDLAAIIAHGAAAAGARMTVEQAGAAVVETGLGHVYPAALAFCTYAMTGGTEAEGEGDEPGEANRRKDRQPPSAG